MVAARIISTSNTPRLIQLVKEHPASVLDRFAAHPVGDIGVSVITLAELECGITKSSRPARNRAALKQFVSPLEIAAFDRDATVAYGRLRTMLEKKGQPIGSMDLLIAAHAISLDVRLITHNVREFRKVSSLRIEDWA